MNEVQDIAPNNADIWKAASLQTLQRDQAEQLRNTVGNALPVNPDGEAQARKYAVAAGVPITTARAMPEVVKNQAQMTTFDADLLGRKFPTTAQLLLDQSHANMLHDDIPATAQVEHAAKSLGMPANWDGTSLTAGPAPSYMDRLTGWLRDMVGMPAAGRDEGAAARAFLDLQAKRTGTTRDELRQAVGGMSEIPTQFANSFENQFTAGLAPDGTGPANTTGGQIASGVGGLAGFIAGAPLKLAGAAVEHVPQLATTVGDSFVKALGKDMTRQAATLGIASGVTAAGQALDQNNLTDATGVIGKAAKSGAEMGAVFGAAGRLFPDSTALQLAARALSVNATMDAIDGNRPWDDRPLAQKVYDYGLNTVFSLNGAGRTGGGWLHDAARADTAVADAQVLGGLAQAAANSKLRERAPEVFKQFVQSAGADAPIQSVYINAKQLVETLHQGGVGMDELTAKLPDIAQQLPEALMTGGQVEISVPDFATHIVGGKLEQPLMPHLRTDPAGMTLAESQAFYQNHLEQLQAAGADAATQHAADEPFQQSRQQVFDGIKAQLDATGRYRPDVVDAYAALHRDFYATMADRAGVMPHELMEKYPVRIAAESPVGDTLSAGQAGQAPRGAFDPVTKTIALLKGADLSTFLHESGHFFLDALATMAAHPDAPEGIKADMSTLLKSFGVSDLDTWHAMSLDEQRQHHEAFARGFEAYLLDGKAPTLEQRGLFGRFRSWLGRIYKSLSDLGDKVSPEVKGVMDRLIASEDAINQAEQARRYMPLFDTPEKASMSPEDWAQYQALGKDATDTAIEGLASKTVRDMAWLDRTRSRALKALQKDAAEKRRGISTEVRAEVMSQPVYRAWSFLTGRDTTALPEAPSEAETLHASDLKEWKESRESQVETTRTSARAAAWEASDQSKKDYATPQVKGLAKGQFIAKNRKRIELDAQRAMLDWEATHPKPVPPEKDNTATNMDPTTGAGKLNRDALRALAGDDVAKKLQDLRMTSKTGIDPGLVADMFGFKDGAQLATALSLAEHPKDVVSAMVDQRMLERHGEIADPKALAQAADDMVHNEVRTRFIATELRALNKAIGPARDLAAAAKEVAEATIDGRRVRSITEGPFTVAETKAAMAAERRLKDGDTAGAAVAKRDQLLNNQLARAARDALDYIDKSVKYLNKFNSAGVRANIDLEYRDQIDALLDRYDIRKSVSGAALDKREALLSFVERMASQGYEPQIPERLLDEAQRQHYKDMPLGEFKGLVDSVKSIEHLGKLKSRLLDLKETREISDLADEVKVATGKLPQRTPDTNRGLSRMGEKWLDVKAAGRSLQASLLKMEQMIDWLDARDSNGPLNRVVFRRLSEAGVKENDLLTRVKGEIDNLIHANLADVTKDGGKIYTATGLVDGLSGEPLRLTKKQMLMLAGNMGNESNAAKLSAGEKWNQAEVWNFLNAHMSKADWDFVAGMGKTLEGLWPEKLAMSRRLGNTNPDKIQPRAFDTPHGRYEGWYWPLIYDPARAQDVNERGAKQGDALFENTYSRANTDTGRMNTRSENYARPILLDLDVLPKIIKDEIHDIAFREAVIDSDRFLSNGEVRDAIVKALSQQHYDQLRPWLQSIANDGRTSTEGMRALKFFNGLAHGVRTRATMIGLAYQLSTTIVHTSSAGVESIAELGPKWMLEGMKDFANPTQWAANKDFIFERSGEMRNRMNEGDRDVREHLRTLATHMMDPTTGKIARGLDIFKAHGYTMIAAMDMMSALPTWMGAYKRGMAPLEQGGLGMSEQDAIYLADKTVRNAHGGTGVKDMAAVQRGPEMMKLFTMYYTFWNHNVNRIMDTAKLIGSSEHRAAMKDANNWSDSQLAATVIMRTLVYTIGVQALHSLVHPPAPGADQEHWFVWAGKQFMSSAFAGIPILRDLAAHYINGKDYSATPAAGLVKIIDNTRIDAMNALMGEHVSDKWIRHTITTAGAAFNLPLGGPSAPIQFLWDVVDGNQHPDSAADWWNGILHGDMKTH